jgi:hypothetical protein
MLSIFMYGKREEGLRIHNCRGKHVLRGYMMTEADMGKCARMDHLSYEQF